MNYVNIEITKMLPPNLHNDWTNAWWIPSKYYEPHTVEQFGDWWLVNNPDIADENEEVYKAWTYEEVRVWIESKGYEIELIRYGKNRYCFKIWYDSDDVIDVSEFTFYEEARNEGIIKCLKMINYEMELQDRDKNQ